MTNADVKYPVMRLNLFAYLDEITAIGAGGPDPKHDAHRLDEVVHFFFDDSRLADDIASTIGAFLLDEREAEVVGRVVRALDRLPETSSDDTGRDTFIHDPIWAEVVAAAREARAVLDRPDLPGIVRRPGAVGGEPRSDP